MDFQEGFLQRASAVSKSIFRKPVEASKCLLYEQGLRYKRIAIRQRYRSTPLQEPRYLCLQCGKRFESERKFKDHDAKKRKDHARLVFMEELFASQTTVIREAKYLLTGVYFPAFYELNNTLLLPRYNIS